MAGWHDATDWGTQYTLDIWGDLSQKAPCNNTVGCPSRTTGDSFLASFTASKNNRMDTYSYDASGNLLNDKLSHTFSYDGENRPYSAGGFTYYYDGEGERVAKSSGKLYWFGTNSAPVLETDTSGNTPIEYVFFNGKRVAMRRGDGSVHYYFADQVGSADVVTNATGVMPPEQDIEYHPYGEEQIYANTLGQEYRFTGHEHDEETNDDYFGARYYSSSFGRFLTPDWSATPVAIPYAVMGNPQTLNLYSYVENNPITGTDPDGHVDVGEIVDVISQEANQVANQVGAEISAARGGLATAVGVGVALGLEAYALIDAHAIQMKAAADMQMQVEINKNIQQQHANAQKESEAEPEPQTSTSGDGARKRRGGETAAAALGREKHEEFAAKVKEKAGWKSQPSLTDPKTGKTVKPDAVTKSGKPLELKPNTKTGNAAGKQQLKKYERATGKKGRIIHWF